MSDTKTSTRFAIALCVAACLGLGCSGSSPQPSSQISGVEEAVTVFDCQTQAMQCLGRPPDLSKIDSCRMDLQSCIGQAQKDTQAEDAAVAACRQDAMKCAQAARSGSD